MDITQEKEIKVTARVDFKEHFRFNRYVLARTFRALKAIGIVYMLIFIVVLSSLILIEADKSNSVGDLHIVLKAMKPAILLILIFLSITALLNVLMYFQSKKAMGTDKILQKDQNYNFSDTGIHICLEGGEINLRWEDLYSVEETKYAFYIFIARSNAYILSKSFIDKDKQNSIRDLLKSKMHKKKVKLKKR